MPTVGAQEAQGAAKCVTRATRGNPGKSKSTRGDLT